MTDSNLILTDIMDLLNTQPLEYSIEFSDKDQVLEKQCDDLYRLGYTESIFYHHDIKEREAMSSTAFGNVAIPHILTKSAKKSFISIVIFYTEKIRI